MILSHELMHLSQVRMRFLDVLFECYMKYCDYQEYHSIFTSRSASFTELVRMLYALLFFGIHEYNICVSNMYLCTCTCASPTYINGIASVTRTSVYIVCTYVSVT